MRQASRVSKGEAAPAIVYAPVSVGNQVEDLLK